MDNLSKAAIWATIAAITAIVGLVIALNNKNKSKNAQENIKTNDTTTNENSGNKQRNGCVTAWLIIMIIANSWSAILYLFAGDMVAKNIPNGISNPMLILLAILGLVNVVSSILLFKWEKIGFWGFVITSIGVLIVNLSIGLGIGQSLFGLVGIAVLYGVLQIKKDNVKLNKFLMRLRYCWIGAGTILVGFF
jgi:hypothetical protein